MHNNVGKLAGLEIATCLADLWKRYPGGLSIKDLVHETGLPYHTAHAAAVWIADNGQAKWQKRPDQKATSLVPVDWATPAWDLTEKQTRLLEAIIAAADDQGLSCISYRQMTIDSGGSAGSITAHIDALDRKGYIAIITLGSPRETSCFKAYPQGDGPRGYSQRRMSANYRCEIDSA